MFYRYLTIFSILITPIIAKPIQSIDFEFPPSNTEWKKLVDITPSDEEDFYIDEEEDFDEEYEAFLELQKVKFQCFTHKEEGFLELFYVLEMPYMDLEFEICQESLDKSINIYLPNHRLLVEDLIENSEEKTYTCRLNDGQEDLFQTYTRSLKNEEKVILLFCLSTTPTSEANTAIWTHCLNQATLSE